MLRRPGLVKCPRLRWAERRGPIGISRSSAASAVARWRTGAVVLQAIERHRIADRAARKPFGERHGAGLNCSRGRHRATRTIPVGRMDTMVQWRHRRPSRLIKGAHRLMSGRHQQSQLPAHEVVR